MALQNKSHQEHHCRHQSLPCPSAHPTTCSLGTCGHGACSPFTSLQLANPWRGKGVVTPQCSGLAAAKGSNSHGLVSGFQVCLYRWLWFPPLLKGPCFYRTRSNKTLKHVLISQGKSGPWRSMFQKNALSWIRATVMVLPPPKSYLSGTSQCCLSPAKTENLY